MSTDRNRLQKVSLIRNAQAAVMNPHPTRRGHKKTFLGNRLFRYSRDLDDSDAGQMLMIQLIKEPRVLEPLA